MSKEHVYNLTIKWTGNCGAGTSDYRAYQRNHLLSAPDKPEILCSSDPAFRGDKTMYNPEELLIGSLSGCHMLWFLHICANNGVVVLDYIDNPTGIMMELENGAGRFKEVILNPMVTVLAHDSLDKLDDLHQQANKMCFIANSVNFEVKHNSSGKIMD